MVVRAEEDGNIPYGSLQQIVDAHAKTASDISHIAIMIDARKKSIAVDHQDISIFDICLSSIFISHYLATCQQLLNLFKMIFANDMGRNNQLPVLVLIKVTDKDFFIRRPATACHEALHPSLLQRRGSQESLNHRELLGSFLDLKYAVKTGIANDCNIGNANLSQQLLADSVLHKEMSEAVEHTPILATIPLKEQLVRAEDTRYAINRNMTMLQDMQIVVPKLVLDEESHHRVDGTQETASVSDGVERQVSDDISTFVVLAHLIAGRREECEQDLIFRMIPAQLLHERATLFELSQ